MWSNAEGNLPGNLTINGVLKKFEQDNKIERIESGSNVAEVVEQGNTVHTVVMLRFNAMIL